jgi:hypothetical protein
MDQQQQETFTSPVLERLWSEGWGSRVTETVVVGDQGFLRPVATWRLCFHRGQRVFVTEAVLTRFGSYAVALAAACVN